LGHNSAVATAIGQSVEARLRELFAQRIAVLDGAWGTMLQGAGLSPHPTGTAAPSLAAIEPNEKVPVLEVKEQQNQNKPPPRYTEATLLSGMEGAAGLSPVFRYCLISLKIHG
jgi:DNA topoisomerase IA